MRASSASSRSGPPEALDASTRAVVDAAIARLRDDGFVAYATETVWGLGACADRPVAIDRLMQWKGRGSDAPLAVLVPSAANASLLDSVESLGCRVGDPARRLMDAFWPGPLMLVLPCEREWAPGVTRAGGALGVRCSSNSLSSQLAAALAEAGLGPLTSTSFNRTGAPPATTGSEAAALTQRDAASLAEPLLIDLPGQDAGGERPSTVVDCTNRDYAVLREGAIAADEIASVISG